MSLSITESLKKEISSSNAGCIHLFLPITQHKEIDLWPFIKWVWANLPSVQIVIPKCDFKTRKMVSYVLKPNTILTTENHGIPEPIEAVAIKNTDIDIVITPLIICDEEGHRIGYGKGFYDAFFNSVNKNTKRIGIGYFEPVNCVDNTDEWDIPLTHYISPTKVYTFKN